MQATRLSAHDGATHVGHVRAGQVRAGHVQAKEGLELTAQSSPSPLAVQQALSDARQSLGRAQLSGAPPERIAALFAHVERWERLEARQLEVDPASVEKARLQVFLRRFQELELARGPLEALWLARSTYYTGRIWSAASGAPMLTQAELNALGFPRGAPNGQFDNDGYLGDMRLADGRRFDMGHLLCVLDFALNREMRPEWFVDPVTGARLPNPFTPNAVGLAGDLATAVIYWGANPAITAYEALITSENNSDLRGDIFGALLAAQALEYQVYGAELSVSALLKRFFAQPPSRAEMVDDFGEVAPKSTGREALIGATLVSRGASFFEAVRRTPGVLRAFDAWLDDEAVGRHPLGDYETATTDDA